MYTGGQLRAPFDPVVIGFARLARAPHVVHALLDAGQRSAPQLALVNVPHTRDVGCPGEWTAFRDAAHG
ncbi:hypothetical protein [Burkholderia gladioli]|uniref:hypothetical protein n=1 Tax=Burkholderia gladioli TaxID=28095 RepID=UPI00163F756A|nr:hypothetical protein [Burkholderia gladioli]